jgi:putative FmdB family regulatory protein
MPTYEYECQNCGHTFDVLQRITEDPLTDCPKCKMPQLKRLIGAGIGIIFKGSGFYTTDYKSSGSSSGSGSDGKSSGKSNGESKSESKASDSKSDSKSEAKKT